MKYIYIIVFAIISSSVISQEVPASYSNLYYDGNTLMLDNSGNKQKVMEEMSQYSYKDIVVNPIGTKRGLKFTFGDKTLEGTIYYGFINYNDGKYNYPVYFKRPAIIRKGVAEINIASMAGKYDMINWEENKKGTIGYRIVDRKGSFLYDGVINFKGVGPFNPCPTIIEGPFVSNIGSNKVTIWFKTNILADGAVIIDDKEMKSEKKSIFHSFTFDKLKKNTEYDYTVKCDIFEYKYTFKTSPLKGDKTKFTFAYASDSRAGLGGGERNVYGVNSYIMKKISSLAMQENVAFMQFTGDLVNGYSNSISDINLQYSNWKKSVEPFAHYIPVYVGQGNHEALTHNFSIMGLSFPIGIDKFPFETQSAEAVFANNFVLPENGPLSEDGAKYDPSKNIDFPPYKETVYYYTYGNTAVVVLNSDYWYAPLIVRIPQTSGNLHGYIMDNQLDWLQKTIQYFEDDKEIDHVFVTLHTPAFPNGGHSYDDMWYSGNNKPRAIVNSKPLKQGIIERRDAFLDVIINKSTKVVAILTGDEHNYCKLTISEDMPRYPEEYDKKKLKLNRTIYQINNGAAGAPYYAQEKLPWSKFASGFTTQNAIVLIDVEGDNINVRVKNPDTLEDIETYKLK